MFGEKTLQGVQNANIPVTWSPGCDEPSDVHFKPLSSAILNPRCQHS